MDTNQDEESRSEVARKAAAFDELLRQEQEEAPNQSGEEFAVELLVEGAGNCLIMARAIQAGKPFQNGLGKFDGMWLMMRVMVESLTAEDNDDEPRRQFIDLSAKVLAQLKEIRREIIRPSD
jgi:hypothetical protein